MTVREDSLLERFAALRLRGWLSLMETAEQVGLGESALYYWLVRRAAGCHRWRS